MKLKRIISLASSVLVLSVLMATCIVPVYAVEEPKLPHSFYGDLTINDNPAPIGVTVEAQGIGVVPDIIGNPVTTAFGKYGSEEPFEQKLVVQGDIAEGAIITFHVTNAYGTGIAEETGVWHAGDVTKLDLTVTIVPPPPPSGGGGAPPPEPELYYLETNIFGEVFGFPIGDDCEILETIEVTSEDGMFTITIPEGTYALDKDGNCLDTLDVTTDTSPPAPPEGSHIIGIAYSFSPEGATFNPPITFTWSYDPDDLPEGAAEKDLVIAYYDEDAGEWVELDCVVDTENNTVTASVHHFTTFALIGGVTPAAFSLSSLVISPAEVAPGEAVTISVSVANTGGQSGSFEVTLKINGVVEATKEVTVAGGKSQSVSFTTSKDVAGTYSVDINGLTGSFTVKEEVVAPPPLPPAAPAAFTVSSLSISPSEVDIGEQVTISVLISNTGELTGSYEVTLKIDNVVIATKDVTLAGGATQKVFFTTAKGVAGTCAVTVDGLSGTFTVKAAPPPAPPALPKPILWFIMGFLAAVMVAVSVMFLVHLIRRGREL